MANNAQTRVFGRKEGSWVWCLHCERCYQVGEFRILNDLEFCPYPRCSGDTITDSYPWEDIRKSHPDYPEIPERDKNYSLF